MNSLLVLALIILGVIAAVVVYVLCVKRTRFVTRPARKTVKEILEKTDQIGQERAQEIQDMSASETASELNRSYKKLKEKKIG